MADDRTGARPPTGRPVLETARLRLRELTEADLDDMAALLGDPAVMAWYPAPKSRAEAAAWIARNRARYAADGFGLWAVETTEGTFVGDCGLTVQEVGGRPQVEVGFHVRTALQRRGYAAEASAACRDLAWRLGVPHLIAIIHPENVASQRTAEKIGLQWEGEAEYQGRTCRIYGAAAPPGAHTL